VWNNWCKEIEKCGKRECPATVTEIGKLMLGKQNVIWRLLRVLGAARRVFK
jgi:hypothetical protein